MQFMIAAFLKPGAEEQLIDYHDELNEHLGPGADDVRIAGALQDTDGRRVGYMAIVRGNDIGDANDWLHESPFYKADLYERIDVSNMLSKQGAWTSFSYVVTGAA